MAAGEVAMGDDGRGAEKEQRPTAAILVIGDELLSGKIEDRNVQPLARLLRAKGIRLAQVLFRGDDRAGIAEDVRRLSAGHTWLFTSGGVGPTHDDVTIAAVADAFGRAVVEAEETAAQIRAHYGERVTAGHLRMALVPEGCELVVGGGSRWPTVRVANTFVLPGVPQAFRMKLAVLEEVLPRAAQFAASAVYTAVDEPALVPPLDAVAAAFPDVAIGSYPKWFDARYKTKVTFDGDAADRVAAARDAFLAALPAGSVVEAPEDEPA